jgi:hypothetical protein
VSHQRARLSVPRTIVVILALTACTHSPPAEVQLIGGARRGQRTVEVRGTPGLRINARLAPAIESEGTVLRVTQGALTADSAYFTDAPWTVATIARGESVTVRASVCDDGARLCRTVTLATRMP